jgi:hypothetical protein
MITVGWEGYGSSTRHWWGNYTEGLKRSHRNLKEDTEMPGKSSYPTHVTDKPAGFIKPIRPIVTLTLLEPGYLRIMNRLYELDY